MALRPRLSTGLLFSVSMLGRFDWRYVTTALKASVKQFALTIVLDFPVKYHLERLMLRNMPLDDQVLKRSIGFEVLKTTDETV